jgi:hypothetical protein
MRPRLFSMLRALKHENPLVGFAVTVAAPQESLLMDWERDYHGPEAFRACNAVFLSDDGLSRSTR